MDGRLESAERSGYLRYPRARANERFIVERQYPETERERERERRRVMALGGTRVSDARRAIRPRHAEQDTPREMIAETI